MIDLNISYEQKRGLAIIFALSIGIASFYFLNSRPGAEIAAVQEFSGDVRRVWQLHHYAPRIEVLVGADDVLLELSTGGVVGWIAGFPNALPKESVELYNLCLAGEYAKAKPIYAAVHNLFNWDSRKEFIVAIKVAMDAVGRYGGPTRLPRLPLPANDLAQLNKDIKQVLDFYKNRK